MTTYRINGDYTPERGFGLITGAVRAAGAVPQGAELNAGFEPAAWYREHDEFRYGQTSGFLPLLVHIDVPAQGNYHVNLTIANDGYDARYGDVSDAGLDERGVLVFGYNRQLAFRGAFPSVDPHAMLTVSAMVPVSDFVARPFADVQPVRAVMLAVVATHARIVSVTVEPADSRVPTVWIAGDSTVTNEGVQYPYAPSDTYCGWGAALSAYLDDRIAVCNHARSGLTSVSFREGHHYDPVRSNWRPGDYLLLQFGHNDQKQPELDARGGYWRELDRYIAEARQSGVHPVLVTSLARNTWNADGGYNDLLRDWAQAVTDLGERRHVPVLDLHALSMAMLKKAGDKPSQPLFHAGDRTHLHDVGAYAVAGLVAGEIRRVLGGWTGQDDVETEAYRALSGHLTGGFGEWPLPPRAMGGDRPQLVVDQYLNPLYLKYTAEPYIDGDISPFRKVMLLIPISKAGGGEDRRAADEPSGPGQSAAVARRPLDVALYVGPAIDPEPVVKARPELAEALAAGHAVALIAYTKEEAPRQDPESPTIPPSALAYLSANAGRYGIDPAPVSVTLLGDAEELKDRDAVN